MDGRRRMMMSAVGGGKEVNIVRVCSNHGYPFDGSYRYVSYLDKPGSIQIQFRLANDTLHTYSLRNNQVYYLVFENYVVDVILLTESDDTYRYELLPINYIYQRKLSSDTVEFYSLYPVASDITMTVSMRTKDFMGNMNYEYFVPKISKGENSVQMRSGLSLGTMTLARVSSMSIGYDEKYGYILSMMMYSLDE